MTFEQPEAPLGYKEPFGEAQHLAKDGFWYTYQDRSIANKRFLNKQLEVEKIQLMYKRKKKPKPATPTTTVHSADTKADSGAPIRPLAKRCSMRKRTNPKRLHDDASIEKESKRTKPTSKKQSAVPSFSLQDCSEAINVTNTFTQDEVAESSGCVKRDTKKNSCPTRIAKVGKSLRKPTDRPHNSITFRRLKPLIVKLRGAVCDAALEDCTSFIEGLVYFERESLQVSDAKPSPTSSLATNQMKAPTRIGSDAHSRLVCTTYELCRILDAYDAPKRRKLLFICETYFLDLIAV